MGGRPVPGRPLALLDDALDGPVGTLQVGDRPEVGPAEGGLLGLVERGADEQPVLPQHLSQVFEAPFHRTVQVTLRAEVLATRHDLLGGHGCQRRPGGLEAHGVGPLDAFRALQVDEVLQRRLAEREQAELHPGRVAASPGAGSVAGSQKAQTRRR